MKPRDYHDTRAARIEDFKEHFKDALKAFMADRKQDIGSPDQWYMDAISFKDRRIIFNTKDREKRISFSYTNLPKQLTYDEQIELNAFIRQTCENAGFQSYNVNKFTPRYAAHPHLTHADASDAAVDEWKETQRAETFIKPEKLKMLLAAVFERLNEQQRQIMDAVMAHHNEQLNKGGTYTMPSQAEIADKVGIRRPRVRALMRSKDYEAVKGIDSIIKETAERLGRTDPDIQNIANNISEILCRPIARGGGGAYEL